ncbi:putative membrane or secreted protein, partial [Rhodopirellula sallentina SM41]
MKRFATNAVKRFAASTARFSVLSLVALASFAAANLAVTPIANAGGGEIVDQAGLFAAMDAGQVEATFIPQNAAKANLLVKNLTEKPLQIQLPAAFAGVPINAQMGGMGGGMGGSGAADSWGR